MKICNIFFLIIIYLSCVSATLSRSDKAKPKNGKYRTKVGPQSTSVSKKLLSSEPSAKDIIIEHNTYFEKTDERNFHNNVLGYVTPWNQHGYNIAKTFTPKFTLISPVWLQLKRKGNLKYEIDGKQDIDSKWVAELRKNNKNVKILPRVMFEGWTIDDYSSVFLNSREKGAVASALVETCKSFKFDGVVLELWTQFGGSIRSEILVDFVNLIAQRHKKNELDVVLVIPPTRQSKKKFFTVEHFNELDKWVSFFSLMTYDYSSPENPGPNSPIDWIRQSVEYLVPNPKDQKRSKILMGLNFYGYDYTSSGGGPIVGNEFINLLKDYKGKLKLDDKSQENFFEVRTNNRRHMVFYPTLYSLQKRIELANELGTGISIWELGQGLDFFYDLF